MKKLSKYISFLLLFFLPLVVFALVTSKTNILGLRSFVVLTGSMEPSLPVGSLIFTKTQEEYKKGDIIAFSQGDINVTHRIVSIENNSGLSQYQTKGDANNVEDKSLINSKDVLGKSVFLVPLVGKLVSFLRTPQGFVLLIIVPALLIIISEVLNIKKELVKKIEKEMMEKLNIEQK